MVRWLTNRFQIKFKDRTSAGSVLGDCVKDRINSINRKDTVVLGIPRGGVITADSLAQKLSINLFDILIPRRLLSPYNEEEGIGAVMEDGTTYLNQLSTNSLRLSAQHIESEKVRQIGEIRRRRALYQGVQERDFRFLIKDKTIILVDDGTSTGSTIVASCRWIKLLGELHSRLIVAIPVAPKDVVSLLKQECTSDVVAAICPPRTAFHSVEQFYKDFKPVPDHEIVEILIRREVLRYPKS